MQHHRACHSKLPVDADWLAESAARSPGGPRPVHSKCCDSRAASTERLLVDSADIGTRLAHPAVTEGKELGRLWPIAPRKCRIAEEKILSPALQLQALGKLSKKKL